MVETEDYFMFTDLALEQEQPTGQVNISELSSGVLNSCTDMTEPM